MSAGNRAEHRPAVNRLVLGTAQLGQPYGIANTTGQPSRAHAEALIRAAWERGLRFFDTAQGYGQSEQALGRALRGCGLSERARIITKLPPALCPADAPRLERFARDSLARLGVPALHALLFHREEHLELLDGPVGEALFAMRGEGLFERFGVSVYSPGAALTALEHPRISIVQIPAGLFDRRFEAAGVFAAARAAGKELHIRSALLQGVLCMTPEALPGHLTPLAPALARFRLVCARCKADPAPLAVAWLLRRHPEALVLFGAETAQQVANTLDFSGQWDHHDPALWEDLEGVVPPQLPELLNPSLWKQP